MDLLQNLVRVFPGDVATQIEQEDVRLVQACQRGDQDAFALLLQRHQHRVFNLVFRMVQDYDDANEVTQEVFLAAWQGLPSFRGEARFSTWLYRIAYHCGVRQLERRKREQVRLFALQAEHTVAGTSNEQEAEGSLEREDVQAAVREHLSHVPMKYRLVLTLRHLEDRTYEEMAQILALPIGTIKTQLFRARNMLKERLLGRS
jgi:RNA polymerase sigma-70 factor, ECF subfamily